MIKGGQKTLPLKIALPCPAAGRKAFRLAFAVLTLVLVGISLAACGKDGSPPPERRLVPATIGVPKASATAPPGDPILVGAGDIGTCSNDRDTQTGALLDAIFAAGNQGYVFAAGDVAYNDGTDAEFAQCYDPAWGQHKSRTKPAPGNHDYFTEGAAGYFAYFGEAAGNPQEGYYSFDLGGWHVVFLNTNDGCEVVSCEAGSPQEQWLRADLAAHPAGCTLAVWHEARFSSGGHGGSDFTSSLWQALYDFGAEIVVSGHDHDYERFAPQTASGQLDLERGIRQFVVGTGGGFLRSPGTPQPNSEVFDNKTYGVLQLTLHPSGYDWTFIPVAGQTFTDTGSANCH